MSRLRAIQRDLIGDVLSIDELESYMLKYDFVPYDGEEQKGVFKFTNWKSMIWILGELDDDNCILVSGAKNVTKFSSELTKVQRFKSFEDLERVQNVFLKKSQYEYWLAGWLCASLGRRCGDIMSLKWDDLFQSNGKFRDKLPIKEQKTGKVVGGVINDLAQEKIKKYVNLTNINVTEKLHMKIFSNGYESFRQALQKAVNEVGLDYPISTHSYRKFYANTNYILHPQDEDRLTIIQTEMGHSDAETTKLYIGAIDDKIERYNKDFSEYILNKEKGIDIEINNSPIVSMKADDYRELLGKLFDIAATNDVNKFDAVNQIIKMTENVMV